MDKTRRSIALALGLTMVAAPASVFAQSPSPTRRATW